MRKPLALIAALAVGATLVVPATAMAAGEHTAQDVVVISSVDGTEIAITVFRPATASESAPVPVILHSHGWAPL